VVTTARAPSCWRAGAGGCPSSRCTTTPGCPVLPFCVFVARWFMVSFLFPSGFGSPWFEKSLVARPDLAGAHIARACAQV
jgi:hypothetical protein